MTSGSSSFQCNHGIELSDAIPEAVSNFMDTYCINVVLTDMPAQENLMDTFENHSQVWNNDSFRKMAIYALIGMGTNMLLNKHENRKAKYIATAIIVLENYNGTGDFNSATYNQATATKLRDLFAGDNNGGIRDVLKLYRKRMTCSCLKELHSVARKTLPKLGACFHCGELKERSSLMICGKCKVHQYCSNECQVAAWPEHKCRCNMYVNANTK